MKTRLIRVYEDDYQTISAVKRALVMQDGNNRTTAEVVSHVLDLALIPADQVTQSQPATILDRE